MALPKSIKIGGAYYKGYMCAVAATTGDYDAILVNTKGAALNSISITPDGYGSGDSRALQHYSDAAGTGSILSIIGESMYNIGKNVPINLDLPAAELINAGECAKFVYTNTAGVALNVYLLAEYVGLKKTS